MLQVSPDRQQATVCKSKKDIMRIATWNIRRLLQKEKQEIYIPFRNENSENYSKDKRKMDELKKN